MFMLLTIAKQLTILSLMKIVMGIKLRTWPILIYRMLFAHTYKTIIKAGLLLLPAIAKEPFMAKDSCMSIFLNSPSENFL